MRAKNTLKKKKIGLPKYSPNSSNDASKIHTTNTKNLPKLLYVIILQYGKNVQLLQ